MDYENGPYLTAAFFCEKLLKEEGDIFSAIRIVDTINAEGPDVEGGVAVVPVRTNALVALRAGTQTGSHKFVLRMRALPAENPAVPETVKEFTEDILFGGPYTGVNAIINLEVNVLTQIGDYRYLWFDVIVDGEVYTRMPLRVIYRVKESETVLEGDASTG